MIPRDPLYANQWHFKLLGRLGSENLIERVWNDYNGTGINVVVFDDGVETAHSDLAANYASGIELKVNGIHLGGTPSIGGRHGTAVAGLIAAENNATGTIGIAHGVNLAAVNIFDPASPVFVNSTDPLIRANFMAAVRQAAGVDVVNNSWSQKPGFRASQNLNDATSFAAQTVAAYADIAATGRNGLGTIIVQAAGNDNLDANGDGLHASRHTITVGAVHQDGITSSYSNYGACLLVSAPGGDFSTVRGGQGIVTSDASGTAGYNLRGAVTTASDFTNDFGGTSAATPIVSATVALMLDANATLGWRDVQNILSLSASHTGSAIGAATPGTMENNTWFINENDNWNGGGQHFSEDYGFGIINTFAAVRMAEVWHLFGAPKSTANERLVTTGILNASKPIADKATTTYTFNVGQNVSMESVTLALKLTHSYFTDLRIFLISPEGTEIQIFDGRSGSGSTTDNGLTWSFGIEALRGENAAGIWTVRIVDAVAADTGTLNTVSLNIYGAALTANDVFTYTDEYNVMAALDAARGILTDTDGGEDWINAAAITGNLSLNLNAGSASSLNGAGFITIASGTTIENAVSGDGGDVLTGNAVGNKFHGMRGDDRLTGGGGNDQLFGGEGNDLLNGGAGADRLDGGAGTLDLATYTPSAAAVIINLATNINTGGDAQGDTLFGIERIFGSHHADSITGDAANNWLYGNGGNDTLNGGSGNDFLSGGAGADIFKVSDSRFGKDTIADFEDGHDWLNFAKAIADNISDFTITGNGTNLVKLSLGLNTMAVGGLNPITLTADDFLFT